MGRGLLFENTPSVRRTENGKEATIGRCGGRWWAFVRAAHMKYHRLGALTQSFGQNVNRLSFFLRPLLGLGIGTF